MAEEKSNVVNLLEVEAAGAAAPKKSGDAKKNDRNLESFHQVHPSQF